MTALSHSGRSIDEVVREARRPVTAEMRPVITLAPLLTERVGFWRALAEDQGRRLDLVVLAPGARVVVLSSVMGSIERRSGTSGWLYSASKAALNSVLKDASIALGARGATCIAVHPGWVQTDMGGAGATLTIDRSVGDLRRLIGGLKPEHNGRFFNHDGTPIPW